MVSWSSSLGAILTGALRSNMGEEEGRNRPRFRAPVSSKSPPSRTFSRAGTAEHQGNGTNSDDSEISEIAVDELPEFRVQNGTQHGLHGFRSRTALSMKNMREKDVEYIYMTTEGKKEFFFVKFTSLIEEQKLTVFMAKKLFSSAIRDHCKTYPGKLTVSTAARWGLTESCLSSTDRAAERRAGKAAGEKWTEKGYTKPWNLCKVLLSDGRHGEAPDQYYATDNLAGGWESYYPIRFYSLRLNHKIIQVGGVNIGLPATEAVQLHDGHRTRYMLGTPNTRSSFMER